MDDHTPDVCTPLVYRGRLYVLDGDSRTMTCIDPASGQRIWQEKLPGRRYRSSPLGADGKIYCIDKSGTIVVLAAGDEYRLISQTTVPGKPCLSSIVPCRRGLLVRTSQDLRCFGR
jgi:outer membrane protein assembly factor BamB